MSQNLDSSQIPFSFVPLNDINNILVRAYRVSPMNLTRYFLLAIIPALVGLSSCTSGGLQASNAAEDSQNSPTEISLAEAVNAPALGSEAHGIPRQESLKYLALKYILALEPYKAPR